MKRNILIIVLCVMPLICSAQNISSTASSQEDNKEQIYIPKDLEDCFSELKKILPKEQIEEFKNTKEEDVIGSAHMGLGRWMRNNWGLWSGNSRLAKYFKDKGVNHPDDMSGIILTSFYRHLNNKDIRLDEQVDVSKKWWEKKTITRDNLKYDAIEDDPKYKEVIKKAEEEAEKNVSNLSHPKKNEDGYCHVFWSEKKRILKEKYGMDWKTPAELNPNVRFD